MQNKPKPTASTSITAKAPKLVPLNPSPARKHSTSQQSMKTTPISKSDQKPLTRGDEVTLRANTSDINSEGKSSGVHSKNGAAL